MSLKSVSVDVLKLIVARLKLSAKFSELIWSSFEMLILNCQLKHVSYELPVDIRLYNFGVHLSCMFLSMSNSTTLLPWTH